MNAQTKDYSVTVTAKTPAWYEREPSSIIVSAKTPAEAIKRARRTMADAGSGSVYTYRAKLAEVQS